MSTEKTEINFFLTDATQNEYSDRTESLLAFLKHFNHSRHHVTNPEGKKKAQEFIHQTFQDLGLVTWLEKFEPDYPKVTILCFLVYVYLDNNKYNNNTNNIIIINIWLSYILNRLVYLFSQLFIMKTRMLFPEKLRRLFTNPVPTWWCYLSLDPVSSFFPPPLPPLM